MPTSLSFTCVQHTSNLWCQPFTKEAAVLRVEQRCIDTITQRGNNYTTFREILTLISGQEENGKDKEREDNRIQQAQNPLLGWD